jgi:hypothetical protein
VSRTEPETVVDGRFEILRAAGSGGMGTVYQARDHESGRTVALKVLREADQVPRGRFANEVAVLSALDHPRIVGYVSHGVTGRGSPYLVMPWLDGTDLETRLESGALSIDETLAMARGVADALAYLHGRGLIHRDLKPANLFLPGGDVGRVQLIDLGFARESGPPREITESGVVVGTPNFIAPEQARGESDVAPAADVFAFGCVLFECLTGRRLFTGAHVMSILAKILLEDAPRVSEIRPDVPAFLDLLVSRMVEKDPAKRPSDGAELAKWLSESGRGAIPPMDALTANERRFVTVLVAALPSGPASGPGDEGASAGGPFQAPAKVFGVRAQVLADRTAIVLAPEHLAAADQASLLARFARHLLETHHDAKVAMSTGSASNTTRLPVGQAIDRAVAMVRAPESWRGVRVDDATAALIAARFEVSGGRVVSERVSLDPTRRLLGKPTSCVGRERELALLEASFAACDAGDGPKVVLVTAEAGAGKSRLQHELDRRLHAQAPGVQVLRCCGDPFHASIPYSMVSQVVRQAAGLLELVEPEQVKERLLAHVASLVPPADVTRVSGFIGELVDVHFDDHGDLPLRAARQNPVAMADQIGRAFEDLLRAWCARQPLVIVLEDLHWAHGSCVKLLDRTLWKLPGARFLLLALARPEVHGRFPALFAKRDVTEVQLPPLPRSASARLVQEVLGGDVSTDDVERIVEHSEGNAFYLEELIRAVDEPALSSGEPGARARQGHLPEAVLAVAQARLERLEPEARKVLRAASVFGDVFWLEAVSALVGQAPAQVTGVLAGLVEYEAIVPTQQPRLAGASEYAFRHALLRGTAYATLTEEDRKLGHRLAAGWLRDMREDNELVARHWLEGGDRAQAAAAFVAAAESRRRRSQPDAAARSVARALLVLTAESVDIVMPCIALLAEALTATRSLDAADVIAGIEGHVPRFDTTAPNAGRTMARTVMDRALELLRHAEDPGLVAALASAAIASGALAEFAAAKSFLDEATARAAGDADALRRVRYASGTIAFWSGNGNSGVELLADSTLPEEPAARRQILLMLSGAVVMVGGRAALARGLDLVDQAAAIKPPMLGGANEDLAEDPVAGVLCAMARQLCFIFGGEHAKAAEVADEGAALARRAGLRYQECAQLCNAAEEYLRLGDRNQARARALESNAIARDIGADRAERHNDTLLAYLDGDRERLRHTAAQAIATSDTILDLYAHSWLGHLLAETGAPGSRPALERAISLARDLGIQHVADECARVLAGLELS